ncbi:MAG: NapC/NirT family cytochrome c [gamma proteobacterium symbiont of Lucinoma myriamae]|nr:NapC/NirT family cytochrome c [gamma proteobacterium symbiont of Lucinoma myriamae]MCU7819358.1 NapC/NirT family cytochrome c [gamma proteobacterium symbiont of Lucinoma myriamae]MCU7832568.1 NapC/NirT family cytochrome c [gamma proteobacterium symbiont of Lucinoma myriamae]
MSIVQDWGNSMMANATTDPFWRAKVASELKRNPHLASEINDTCSKCHAPIAHYEITEVQEGEITLFGDNGVLNLDLALNPTHEFYNEALNGVSCTVCHQITDDDSLGTLEGFSGEYKINNSKITYGQFSNIETQQMINNTGYTPAYSAHVSDSALCATCHNLKTPFVDNTGEIIPQTEADYFPEQMPYTEWENSDFDDSGSTPQSCQDCHMPKTTAKLSTKPGNLAPKDGFAKHHLAGANTTMLTLLKDNALQLDVISSDLDSGIERARTMLKSAVNIEIVSTSVNNGILEARVKLANNSGHKTPTAYPSRRMWLHFKVTYTSKLPTLTDHATLFKG